MKLSLVDEIILIILQVLTAVLATSSVSSVVKENSNENGSIYSNNQHNIGTLMTSSNHSARQMWKCMRCYQRNKNVGAIEKCKYTCYQKHVNDHNAVQEDIFQNADYGYLYNFKNIIDCMYDGFDLKWNFFKKHKHSVCASIEVDGGCNNDDKLTTVESVQMMSCDKLLQYHDGANAELGYQQYIQWQQFWLFNVSRSKQDKLQVQIYSKFNLPVQVIIINTQNAASTNLYSTSHKPIIKQNCSSSVRYFNVRFFFFFYYFFKKQTKKNLYRLYDVAQKRNMDDTGDNDNNGNQISIKMCTNNCC
ncbi:hypothetical protein RFI_38723 [Reticulomyxa filosa]|uniref:Uncharacterized protein n=1 Tax=Reticulomyxa filosa TaxID=46433 RepID=X6L9P3_RETFI|nr:hypothetical protein RFI_38723 [Reticulomyxa filosa]|eukprot:ETN98762.1 hypothetical protein RFI_38723 [Reticulomyxa filosa]